MHPVMFEEYAKLFKESKARIIDKSVVEIARLDNEDSIHMIAQIYKRALPIHEEFTQEAGRYTSEGQCFIREVEKYIQLNLHHVVYAATRRLWEEAIAAADDCPKRELTKMLKSIAKVETQQSYERAEKFAKWQKSERRSRRRIIKPHSYRIKLVKESLAIIADLRRTKPRSKITETIVARRYHKRPEASGIESAKAQYSALLTKYGISFRALLLIGKTWEEMTKLERENAYIPLTSLIKSTPKRPVKNP